MRRILATVGRTPRRGAPPGPLSISERIRPKVWPGGTWEVGPGKPYATIRAATLAAAQGMPTRPSPALRRRVLIHPGVYENDWIGPPVPMIDHIGATGDPADVIITIGTGGNTIVTTGKTCYISGVTAISTSTDDADHPWRDAGPSGDYLPGTQRRTVILDRVVLRSSDDAGAGACALDATPGSGLMLFMHQVAFHSPAQPQTVNIVGGLAPSHGAPGSWYIMHSCHVEGNKYDGTTDETTGTNDWAANVIGWPQGDEVTGDNWALINTTMDVGTFVPVQSDLTIAPQVSTPSRFYVDPSYTGVIALHNGYRAGTPEHTDLQAEMDAGYPPLVRGIPDPLPMPIDGLSMDEHSYWRT